MTTYEKIVKGATKIKVAAPKPKYIEPILLATANKSDFRSVITSLQMRLDDTAWSIVYKSLIVVHIMIREGEPDVTLKYLSTHQDFFNLHHIKSLGATDARSLLRYGKYLAIRAREYASTRVDYVRDEQLSSKKDGGVLRQLSVDKGLLRQVESVEKQIRGLLNCKFNESDINNDVVLTCFRMLVNDLLGLYQALNEGVINILEHYFEMSKYDAQRALDIYKEFVELTTDVVNYLRIAKHLEYATKLHVPTIRHAPTALATSLEDYLNDEGFEVNRSQYLAEREYKSNGALPQAQKQLPQKTQNQPQQAQQQPQQSANPWTAQFGQMSLQPLQVQFTQGQAPVQPVQTLQPLQPQQTNNPFLQMTQQQPQPQQQPQQPMSQVQPQPTMSQLQPIGTGFSTIPASTIVPSFTGAGFGGYTPGTLNQQQTGNPFMQPQPAQPVQPLPQQHQQQQQQQAPAPKLLASKTGNNPFSLNYKSSTLSSVPEASALQPQPTNNPFAASAASAASAPKAPITAQETGTNPFLKQSYTSNRISVGPAASFGGYENLPTQPVFPQTIQAQRTGHFQQQALNGLQQQYQQQFQQFQPQPQQYQHQQYQSYDGPSLI